MIDTTITDAAVEATETPESGRRPLELFELPLAFSQAPLLPPDQFRRERA